MADMSEQVAMLAQKLPKGDGEHCGRCRYARGEYCTMHGEYQESCPAVIDGADKCAEFVLGRDGQVAQRLLVTVPKGLAKALATALAGTVEGIVFDALRMDVDNLEVLRMGHRELEDGTLHGIAQYVNGVKDALIEVRDGRVQV